MTRRSHLDIGHHSEETFDNEEGKSTLNTSGLHFVLHSEVKFHLLK